MLLAGDAALQRRRNHAGADGLGEEQVVAHLRAAIGPHVIWVNRARNGVAELHLFVPDRVPANNDAASFDHLVGAALQDRFEVLNVALVRPGENAERR